MQGDQSIYYTAKENLLVDTSGLSILSISVGAFVKGEELREMHVM